MVSDIDPPGHGLLVPAPTATDVGPPDLVAVDGTIRQFSFDEFRVPFGLTQRATYLPSENRKVLVAAEVRSLA